MSNYDCAGCGSSGSYENKMKEFRGNYSGSGKDDYASGMPDLFMSDYRDSKRQY